MLLGCHVVLEISIILIYYLYTGATWYLLLLFLHVLCVVKHQK